MDSGRHFASSSTTERVRAVVVLGVYSEDWMGYEPRRLKVLILANCEMLCDVVRPVLRLVRRSRDGSIFVRLSRSSVCNEADS